MQEKQSKVRASKWGDVDVEVGNVLNKQVRNKLEFKCVSSTNQVECVLKVSKATNQIKILHFRAFQVWLNEGQSEVKDQENGADVEIGKALNR